MNTNAGPTSRTWRVVLTLMLASELIFYACLRQLGWLGTGNAIVMATAVIFMAAPILVGLALFMRRRFRFGIRTLLALCLLVALFLNMTVIPLVHYNRERLGTRLLLQHKIYFDQAVEEETSIPVWLSPFFNKERAVPDRSIAYVQLTADSEVEPFIQVAERFPNLSTVLLYKLSDSNQQKLNQTLKRLPKFRELDIAYTGATDISFDSLEALKDLVIREAVGVHTPLRDKLLRDIVKLPLLETIDIHEFDLDSTDLSILAQATQLKTVRFYQCRIASDKVEALKLLMPKTEIMVEHMPASPD